MTTEQEGAAKWEIVEDYKKTKERLEILRNKVSKWGARFVELGERMRDHPDRVSDGEGVGLPDGQELAQTLRELREANGAHEQLTNRMRGIGLEPNSFFR